MKNSNNTIGNRTRDFLTSNGVPQPTEPPRTPLLSETFFMLRRIKRDGSNMYIGHRVKY